MIRRRTFLLFRTFLMAMIAAGLIFSLGLFGLISGQQARAADLKPPESKPKTTTEYKGNPMMLLKGFDLYGNKPKKTNETNFGTVGLVASPSAAASYWLTGGLLKASPVLNSLSNAGSAISNVVKEVQKTLETRVIEIDPAQLRWSQSSAGKGKELTYRALLKNGWNPSLMGDIDVVQTSHGLVTLDNTRPAVALDMGIKKIPVNVHFSDELLPESMAGRFGNAKTWGEALAFRTSKQVPGLPITGTTKPPILMDTKVRPLSGLERLANKYTQGVAPLRDLPNAAKANGIVAEIDGLLARRLSPVINKVVEISKKIYAPIEAVGARLAARFPAAAAAGSKIANALAPVAKVGGVALGGLAIVFGLMLAGSSFVKLRGLYQEEGLATLRTAVGASALIDTVSGVLDTLAGASAVAALASSATVVGGLGFGALALILAGTSLALKGVSWGVQNWDKVVATANKTWEVVSNSAATVWQWSKSAANAMVRLGKNLGQELVSKTRVAASTVINVSVDLSRPLVDRGKEIVGAGYDFVRKSGEAISRGVTSLTALIKKPLNTAVNAARQTFGMVRVAVRQAGKVVKSLAGRTVAAVSQTTGSVHRLAVTIGRTVAPAAMAIGQSLVGGVAAIANTVKSVATAATATKSALAVRARHVASRLSDIVKNGRAVSGLQNIANNVSRPVVNAVKSVINSVSSTASRAVNSVSRGLSVLGTFLRGPKLSSATASAANSSTSSQARHVSTARSSTSSLASRVSTARSATSTRTTGRAAASRTSSSRPSGRPSGGKTSRSAKRSRQRAKRAAASRPRRPVSRSSRRSVSRRSNRSARSRRRRR